MMLSNGKVAPMPNKKLTKSKASRCAGCKHCKRLKAQDDWSFYGCFHKPYKGKWIAEIENCPKESEVDNNDR